MLGIAFFLMFVSFFALAFTFVPMEFRPRLKLDLRDPRDTAAGGDKAKKTPMERLTDPIRKIALINKPLFLAIGKSYTKNLKLAQIKISVEEFLLIKEILGAVFVFLALRSNPDPAFFPIGLMIGLIIGWIGPDFWLKGKVRKVKDSIVKELPDVVDLLGLCVNSGLDFMMAIKYIIEKSPPTIVI